MQSVLIINFQGYLLWLGNLCCLSYLGILCLNSRVYHGAILIQLTPRSTATLDAHDASSCSGRWWRGSTAICEACIVLYWCIFQSFGCCVVTMSRIVSQLYFRTVGHEIALLWWIRIFSIMMMTIPPHLAKSGK